MLCRKVEAINHAHLQVVLITLSKASTMRSEFLKAGKKTVFLNLHSSFVARYETAVGGVFKADRQFGEMIGKFERETPVHQYNLQHFRNMAAFHTWGY